MQRLCLMLTRLCIVAWVGAALFFVLVAIRPMRAKYFDSEQRAHLSQMLFPGYYGFGMGLLTGSLGTGLLAMGAIGSRDPLVQPGRMRVYLAFVAAALAVTLIDWFWVYSPLAAMIADELTQHVALPASFRSLHLASMAINLVSIILSLAAACLGCWPPPELERGLQTNS